LVPATIASAGWWFLIAQILRGPTTNSSTGYALLATTGALAFVMVGVMNGVALLSAYLIRSTRWQAVAAIVIALPILAFLHFSWWIFGAMVASALGMWSAMVTTTHDVRSRLNVRPWASLAAGSTAIVLGTMTALALIIGNQVVGVNQTPQQRVDRLVSGLAVTIEQGLQTALPGVTPTMTIDQAIGTKLPSAESLLHSIGVTDTLSSNQEEQLSKQLRDNFGINADFQAGQTKFQLTTQLQSLLQQYEGQSVDEIRKQLSERVGITLRGSQTVHESLLEVINHQVEAPALKFASYFGLVAAGAAWVLLRLFAPFFTWAAVLCGAGWFWVLRMTKATTIQRRVEEVEHLDWRGK